MIVSVARAFGPAVGRLILCGSGYGEVNMEDKNFEGIDVRGMSRKEREAVFDRIERRRRRGEIPVSEEWQRAQRKLSKLDIWMLKRFQ